MSSFCKNFEGGNKAYIEINNSLDQKYVARNFLLALRNDVLESIVDLQCGNFDGNKNTALANILAGMNSDLIRLNDEIRQLERVD